MSSFVEGAEGSFKKILHAAFVGVESTDQTLIKSYLRVLLRLEADVEWISDDHPHIDLFMIGEEFRDSDSVNKILAQQQQKSVLYVSRNDISNGSIVEDRIILPLRKLDTLYEWLMHSVPKLMMSTEDSSVQENHNPLDRESAAQSLNAQGFESELESNPDSHNTVNADAQTSSNVNVKETLSNSEYQGMIDFIKQLQQRPAGLYQIITQTQTIAIVEPSRARVWLSSVHRSGMSPSISLDWQLRPYGDTHPADSDAKDLLQWLSQCSGFHNLLPLVSTKVSYQLRYWIKPATIVIDDSIGNAASYQHLIAEERRELLQVMTALESAPCNIDKLVQLTGVSVASIKKILANLLFSGSLETESYEQLGVQMSDSSNSHLSNDNVEPKNEGNVAIAALPQTSSASETDNSSKTIDSKVKQTAFEALLERRARGEVAATTTSSAEIVFNTTSKQAAQQVSSNRPLLNQPSAQSDSAQQYKRGFLSRLRQKLGL